MEGSPQDLVLDSSGVPNAANWVVLDAQGTAGWRAQGETSWRRFTRGEVLPAGAEIETGSDGEIMLVAGGDQLTIAPQGRLIVPLALSGQDRRLRHERGHILVQIESRAARNVRIDTPLLSLGIKGTTIEVEVDPEQNSVVVHEGALEVTTPGQGDPVELGAGEGLRQSATPGGSPTRFSAPPPATPAGAAEGPAWRLPAAATDVPAAPETLGPATPSDPAGVRIQSDAAGVGAQSDPAAARAQSDRTRAGGERAARPSRRPGNGFGWLDDLASSWGYLAIIGVALLILAIPGRAFLRNLRAQMRDQSGAQGRRRRELVRG
jgi:FecR protein